MENINIDRRSRANRFGHTFEMWPLNPTLFSPLVSLLFFSDLNRTSNQLSFWSPLIHIDGSTAPWVLCLLLTENTKFQRRTESTCDEGRKGCEHNLLVMTPLLYFSTGRSFLYLWFFMFFIRMSACLRLLPFYTRALA